LKDLHVHFFIGTEAELYKLFPVIRRLEAAKINCHIITNGQNDISGNLFLDQVQKSIELDICVKFPNNKRMGAYASWFFRTAIHGKKLVKKYYRGRDLNQNLFIVHGDTLSTMMGAWIANRCNVPYAHIESGLRSHNLLSPFPEEIDRYYASLHSVINFCPKKEYALYAAKAFRGKAVDTVYNTGLETLFWALENNKLVPKAAIHENDYFMFMLHRQENLLNRDFLCQTMEHIIKLAAKIHCVFIYHTQTKAAMESAGIWSSLAEHPNFTLLSRRSYQNFISLVEHSKFVISDGCGNQQEFFYMGKPYLILRNKVEEDSEGLNFNAKVFGGDLSSIERFYDDYTFYEKPAIVPTILPSEIICEEILQYFSSTCAKCPPCDQ
jgi:UDP-N-acetylglucosamine 2-epimerase (non-hydrolysing)